MRALDPYYEMLINEWRELGRPNMRTLEHLTLHRTDRPDIITQSPEAFAQHGEDLIAAAFISARLTDVGDWSGITYIEVGANHPMNMSNTWLFYQRGARGVLVEPNKRLCQKLTAARPEDQVVNAGVQFDDRTLAVFYETSRHEVSGFDREFLLRFIEEKGGEAKGWRFAEEYEVELVSLNALLNDLEREGPVALLSIDAEGLDLKIIQRTDFEAHRPTLVMVEPSDSVATADHGSKPLTEHMTKNGYALIARTTVNLIFADRRVLEQ